MDLLRHSNCTMLIRIENTRIALGSRRTHSAKAPGMARARPGVPISEPGTDRASLTRRGWAGRAHRLEMALEIKMPRRSHRSALVAEIGRYLHAPGGRGMPVISVDCAPSRVRLTYHAGGKSKRRMICSSLRMVAMSERSVSSCSRACLVPAVRGAMRALIRASRAAGPGRARQPLWAASADLRSPTRASHPDSARITSPTPCSPPAGRTTAFN